MPRSENKRRISETKLNSSNGTEKLPQKLVEPVNVFASALLPGAQGFDSMPQLMSLIALISVIRLDGE